MLKPSLRDSGMSRRDIVKIARRFNAGKTSTLVSSPEGTAESSILDMVSKNRIALREE
jgi:hypothetical protein